MTTTNIEKRVAELKAVIEAKENELAELQKQMTYEKDFAQGYADRKAHCYDKWYRYNRSDDGAAYDAGCVKFVNEHHSQKWYDEDKKEWRLIECMH